MSAQRVCTAGRSQEVLRRVERGVPEGAGDRRRERGEVRGQAALEPLLHLAPSNTPSTRRVAIASRTSCCSSSWLLVSTQRSVSSSCRFTQMVSDDASSSTQAMAMSV